MCSQSPNIGQTQDESNEDDDTVKHLVSDCWGRVGGDGDETGGMGEILHIKDELSR